MRYEPGIAPWPKVPGTPVCILLLHIGPWVHGRQREPKRGYKKGESARARAMGIGIGLGMSTSSSQSTAMARRI